MNRTTAPGSRWSIPCLAFAVVALTQLACAFSTGTSANPSSQPVSVEAARDLPSFFLSFGSATTLAQYSPAHGEFADLNLQTAAAVADVLGQPYLVFDSTLVGQDLRAFTVPNAVFSPDGTHLVYTRSGLHVRRVDGSNDRLLAADGQDPMWSPDSARLTYRDRGGLQLFHLEENRTRTLDNRTGAATLAWSPDGDELLIGVAGQVNRVAWATGTSRPLSLRGINVQGQAAWLPDGRTLLLRDGAGFGYNIAQRVPARLLRVDLERGEQTVFIPAQRDGGVLDFTVSADGAWVIAWTVEQCALELSQLLPVFVRTCDHNLAIVPSDGAQPPITITLTTNRHPNAAPRIAFTDWRAALAPDVFAPQPAVHAPLPSVPSFSLPVPAESGASPVSPQPHGVSGHAPNASVRIEAVMEGNEAFDFISAQNLRRIYVPAAPGYRHLVVRLAVSASVTMLDLGAGTPKLWDDSLALHQPQLALDANGNESQTGAIRVMARDGEQVIGLVYVLSDTQTPLALEWHTTLYLGLAEHTPPLNVDVTPPTGSHLGVAAPAPMGDAIFSEGWEVTVREVLPIAVHSRNLEVLVLPVSEDAWAARLHLRYLPDNPAATSGCLGYNVWEDVHGTAVAAPRPLGFVLPVVVPQNLCLAPGGRADAWLLFHADDVAQAAVRFVPPGSDPTRARLLSLAPVTP